MDAAETDRMIESTELRGKLARACRDYDRMYKKFATALADAILLRDAGETAKAGVMFGQAARIERQLGTLFNLIEARVKGMES